MSSPTDSVYNHPTSLVSTSTRSNEEVDWDTEENADVVEMDSKCLSEELNGSYEVEGPEEDEPPRGRKRTRSECNTEWVNPLQDVFDEPVALSSSPKVPMECEVDESHAPSQILEDFAARPEIPNLACTKFEQISYDQISGAAEEISGSDATLPRTQSEQDIHNISNELFLFSHTPGCGAQVAPQVLGVLDLLKEMRTGADSDIASADLGSDDEDFPLPEIRYNSPSTRGTPYDESYADRVRYTAPTQRPIWSLLGIAVGPVMGEKVLDEFLKSSIEKTRALHADGTWTSRMKAKEIERIVESFLIDEKRIDVPEWAMHLV